MILLVCGDRHWTDRDLIAKTLDHCRTKRSDPMTVIEGGAQGADRLAGQWAANRRKIGVAWVRVPADWQQYGKKAGPIRNQQMLDYVLRGRTLGQVVGVLAFHDDLDKSKGTKDMVTRSRRAGVPVKVMTHFTL